MPADESRTRTRRSTHRELRRSRLGEQFPVDGSSFDHLFAANGRFSIGHLEAVAIPVPGHTQDSVAYLIGDALFVGDSLFMPTGGSVRCHFPGGDAATLYRSIQRLLALPDATRVSVCHDYPADGCKPHCESSSGEQKRDNIHVHQGIDETRFVALRTRRDTSLATPALILPSIEVNIRAGILPDPEDNGVSHLRLPLNRI